MRKTVYFPRSLVNDSNKEGGAREKNSGSRYDAEIIEPSEYLGDEQRLQQEQQLQQQQKGNKQSSNDILKRFFPDILKAIGNKAIKESPPTLQELEAYLQQYISNLDRTSRGVACRLPDISFSESI